MRNRGQSLFRRAYDYAPAAAGLSGVPIQVWSTKSFAATWQAAGDPQKPILDAKLRAKRNGPAEGEITWLPGDIGADPSLVLKEAYLIYGNQALEVSLTPGTPLKVNTRAGKELSSWYSRVGQPNNQSNYGQRGFTNLDKPIRGALFFEELNRGTSGDSNSCLRTLDQSWRLGLGEAILLARFAPQQGPAETVTQHLASASRLWLGKLPAAGETRPALDGILRQDTYIRVFLPVKVEN
jgi:hypothetical protein